MIDVNYDVKYPRLTIIRSKRNRQDQTIKKKSKPLEVKYPGTDKNGVFYTRQLLESYAYRSLTGTAKDVLNIFFFKRQVLGSKIREKLKIDSCSAANVRDNNITFTSREATKMRGIRCEKTFKNAIDKLIEVGFINVKILGGRSRSTVYELCDRWMKYGTPEFIKKKRKRRVLSHEGMEDFLERMPERSLKRRVKSSQ